MVQDANEQVATDIDEVEQFGRAFVPLCVVWLWWVIAGSFSINGISPVGWVLAPIVLMRLFRLRKSTSDRAAWYFTWCIAIGVVAAVVMYVGRYMSGRVVGSPATDTGWVLVTLGLVCFSRGMQRWLRLHDLKQDLQARWRRSEMWAWVAAITATPALARLAWHDQPLDSIREVHGVVRVIAALALGLISLGALLSVAISASATKDSLKRRIASSDPSEASEPA